MTKIKISIITSMFLLLSLFTSFAGEWKQDENQKWWYQNDDGSRPIGQWQEINGRQYYFNDDGYMLSSTTTPDGKIVGADGSWIGKTKLYEGSEADFKQEYCRYFDSLIAYAQNEDYKNVLLEMDGNQYKEIIFSLIYEGYCYPTKTGKGIKIQSNYLYFGDLVDGKAEGNGIAFNIPKKEKNPYYAYYSGEWHNDMPNGSGIERFYDKNYKLTVENSGSYVDWYQDGNMISKHFYYNITSTYEYKVVDKIPVSIGKTFNKSGYVDVVAWAKENDKGYLTFYNTPQTAAQINNNDGIRKNAYGYWLRNIS